MSDWLSLQLKLVDQDEQKDEDLLLWALIQDVLQDDKPLHAWERRRIRLMELTPPSCLTQYVPQSSLYCKVLIITLPWSSSWGPTTSISSCTTSGRRTVLLFSTPPWNPRPGSSTWWIPSRIMRFHLMSAAVGARDTGHRGETKLWVQYLLHLLRTKLH